MVFVGFAFAIYFQEFENEIEKQKEDESRKEIQKEEENTENIHEHQS